jgi:hypothetical protein
VVDSDDETTSGIRDIQFRIHLCDWLVSRNEPQDVTYQDRSRHFILDRARLCKAPLRFRCGQVRIRDSQGRSGDSLRNLICLEADAGFDIVIMSPGICSEDAASGAKGKMF